MCKLIDSCEVKILYVSFDSHIFPCREQTFLSWSLQNCENMKIHFQTISPKLMLDQRLRALFKISKMKQELTKDRDISYYIHHVCFEVQLWLFRERRLKPAWREHFLPLSCSQHQLYSEEGELFEVSNIVRVSRPYLHHHGCQTGKMICSSKVLFMGIIKWCHI